TPGPLWAPPPAGTRRPLQRRPRQGSIGINLERPEKRQRKVATPKTGRDAPEPWTERVQKFNSSYIGSKCGHSCGNGQFNSVYGIVIDGSGNIWVGDQTQTVVQVFNSSGSWLMSFGSAGTGNGQFNSSPYGITIHWRKKAAADFRGADLSDL